MNRLGSFQISESIMSRSSALGKRVFEHAFLGWRRARVGSIVIGADAQSDAQAFHELAPHIKELIEYRRDDESEDERKHLPADDHLGDAGASPRPGPARRRSGSSRQ